MKHLIFFIALLGSFISYSQQKSYNFSLQEAIDFALDSSYTVQNANREVAKALKQKWETTAQGLPQINAEGSYRFAPNIPTNVFTLNGQENTTQFGTRHSGSVLGTITQLIFDGSYLVGLQAASAFVDYTNTQFQKQQLQIVEGVTNSYGAVLLTQESVAVLQQNITTLENNLNETQKIYENGLTEEENVEQLQITLLQIKNQLNNTLRLADIALQMLKLSVGIPISSELKLKDNLEAVTTTKLNTTVAFKDFDITKNNDYRLSELLVTQRKLELKLEKSKALPTLGAYAQYGADAFTNNFDQFVSTNQRWFYNSAYGLSLKVPIFSSFARTARTKQAQLAYEQAVIGHDENTERITLAYEQALSDYEFALANLSTLEQNLKLAERIENKNQVKFEEGIASSFDLRQAQTQLYTAQQQYLEAQLKIIQDNAKLQSILNVLNL